MCLAFDDGVQVPSHLRHRVLLHGLASPVLGNHWLAVVLDLGDGQFAHYAHLQPGSVVVKPGQRVRSGEPLARIGNSGDARWPHLHFQVTTGPDIMDSEGVPFVIDLFRAKGADGNWTDRTLEFPLGGNEVDL